MPYANNKATDQQVHPCSLISVFVICSIDSTIPIDSISIASEVEQAGLSLNCSQTSEDNFSGDVAHTLL